MINENTKNLINRNKNFKFSQDVNDENANKIDFNEIYHEMYHGSGDGKKNIDNKNDNNNIKSKIVKEVKANKNITKDKSISKDNNDYVPLISHPNTQIQTNLINSINPYNNNPFNYNPYNNQYNNPYNSVPYNNSNNYQYNPYNSVPYNPYSNASYNPYNNITYNNYNAQLQHNNNMQNIPPTYNNSNNMDNYIPNTDKVIKSHKLNKSTVIKSKKQIDDDLDEAKFNMKIKKYEKIKEKFDYDDKDNDFYSRVLDQLVDEIHDVKDYAKTKIDRLENRQAMKLSLLKNNLTRFKVDIEDDIIQKHKKKLELGKLIVESKNDIEHKLNHLSKKGNEILFNDNIKKLLSWLVSDDSAKLFDKVLKVTEPKHTIKTVENKTIICKDCKESIKEEDYYSNHWMYCKGYYNLSKEEKRNLVKVGGKNSIDTNTGTNILNSVEKENDIVGNGRHNRRSISNVTTNQ